jgi:hypothetical protein
MVVVCVVSLFIGSMMATLIVLLYPEDKGSNIRNVDKYLPNDTAHISEDFGS